MKTSPRQAISTKAFTVVELLIVIIVIAIIATMAVIVYRGTSTQAYENSLKSDLSSTAANVASYKLGQKKYPSELTVDLKIASAEGGTMTYVRSSDDTYCIDITSSKTPKKFYVTQDGKVKEGDCASTILYLQNVTTANCPTTRTMAVDARDNHTYWVQKMPDGRCWMLTNLAYAGGISNEGANTHGDVKTLQNGSSDGAGAATYTVAKYYINPTTAATNSTTYPTAPSTSTDGGTTNPQYGYYYNWCAAMGNQQGTVACANATTPAYNANVSICPAGWRLPMGGNPGTGHEFELLANSIAANANTPQAAINLQSSWLAQRGGGWLEAFLTQGQAGRFWAGSQYAAQSAHYLYFNKAGVGASYNYGKSFGFSVRCITPA